MEALPSPSVPEDEELFTHVYECIYLICLYVCVFSYKTSSVCLYVSVISQSDIYTYKSSYMHTYTRTHVHTYTLTRLHTYTQYIYFCILLQPTYQSIQP